MPAAACSAWARQAGFTDVAASASAWCFATPAERTWWGGMWADRVVASAFADQAVDRGFSTRDELEEMSAVFRRFAVAADGWFGILHGEILGRGGAGLPPARRGASRRESGASNQDEVSGEPS